MKRLISIAMFLTVLVLSLGAYALPAEDLPSHMLPFEQLVGDNGDYSAKPGDYPPAGTYYIVTDIVNQIVTVYKTEDDSIVRQALCSTGTKATPTPLGEFKMDTRRYRFRFFTETFGQYCSQVNERIFFHSVLYKEKDATTYTVSYSLLGTRQSHGCIRLPVPDARWIYFNVAPGSKAVFTDKVPKNEKLRKSLALPKAPKIRPKDLTNVPQIFDLEELKK